MGFKGYKRTIKLEFDYNQVKKGIPDVNKQMALLNAEFRRASEEVKSYGKKSQELTLKGQHLSKGIQIQKNKIEQLKKGLERAKKGTGDTSKATARYQIALKNAERELLKMEREQKKVNKELDKQKGKLGQASKSWQDFKESANQAGVDVNRVAGNMQKIGAGMMGVGIASGKMFLDFDTEFQKVLTIADDSQVSFDKLRKGALDVARDFNVASGDTANSLYQIQSSGIETKDSLEVLEHSAKLAKTGITDVGTAGDILTTIMNTYGLSVKDAQKITDQLIITQKVAKTTVGDMGQEFGKVAGLAGTAKIPFEEVGSAMAVMTQRGLKTDESLTALRGILTSVIQPTAQAKEVASQYGIQLSLSALKAKGFGGFLEDIVKKTGGSEEAMTQMFGNVRALNGILMLSSKEGMAKYNENLEQIKNSTGATDEAFNKISETASFKLSKSFNELKVSATEAGAKFTPFINLISTLFKALSKLPSSVIVTITALGGLLFTVGSIVKMLDGIFGASGLINTGKGALKGFNSMLSNTTFANLAKWGLLIIGVVAAITALVMAINYLIGKGKEMNRGIDSMSGNMNKARSSMRDAGIRSHAIGTSYFEGGRTRLHEYGDETYELPSGSKVYTAEQSKQLIENMKRDDNLIVSAINKLGQKLDSLENKVSRLPDRQLMLSREMG